MYIVCIAVLAIMVLAVLSITTTIEARISDIESRIAGLEKRIENMAEAGMVLNREFTELDSRSRMRDSMEQRGVKTEQVEEAKKRAGL